MSKRRPMTEEQWLHCTTSYEMVEYLRQHRTISRQTGGRRKMRLFCCGCCRQHWHLFTDERSRNAVEVSERFADGLVRKAELQAAHRAVREAWTEANVPFQQAHLTGRNLSQEQQVQWQARTQLTSAAMYAAEPTYATAAMRIVPLSLSTAAAFSGVGIDQPEMMHAIADFSRRQAMLVRDVFGNPFQPFRLHPGDLGGQQGAVEKMARAIYEEHRFDDMPILADALEDAGCVDSALIVHCREPGEHARGCWVLDALLGLS